MYKSIKTILILILTLTSFSSCFAQNKLEDYKDFFSHYYFVNQNQIDFVGSILTSQNNHSIITTNQNIYVKNAKHKDYISSNQTFIIASKIKKVGKKDAIYSVKGTAKTIKNNKNLLTMSVKSANKEIIDGDNIISKAHIDNNLPMYATNLDKKINTTINSFISKTQNISTYESVIINAGSSSGLNVGTIVYFIKKGINYKNYKLPDEVHGKGFIYRIAKNHALVLIVKRSSAKYIKEISKNNIVTTVI